MSKNNPFQKYALSLSRHGTYPSQRRKKHADPPYELTRKDFDCSEDYVLYLRQSGLAGLDQYGRPDFELISGSGPNAALHQAIHGHDHQAYLHDQLGDEELVQETLRSRALALTAKGDAAPYLSRAEVHYVYDAASFLPQEHARLFNVFITLSYRQLGVSNPNEMTKLLTDFLAEADGQIGRWGHAFHWIYVHECSEEHGLHTHILAHVAPALRKPFTEWARDGVNSFFWRHCAQTSKQAVDIVIKAPTQTRSAASWQWDRVQYITKGMNPDLTGRDLETGQLRPLFELLGQKENFRRPAGIIPFRKRVGGSSSIWKGAQAKLTKQGMPILSAFGDRAWPYLRLDAATLGWEVKEHEARKAERSRREAAQIIGVNDDDVRAGIDASDSTTLSPIASGAYRNVPEKEFYHQIRAARGRALFERHPYLWERNWVGWWRSLPELRRWGSENVRRGLAALAEAT